MSTGMAFSALSFSCAACSQGTKISDLDAFVDAQPWRTLDGTLRDSVWVLVLAEYKRLFPDGPPCKWKDLRAHYEICAPRPVLQRRPPRAVVCLERVGDSTGS